MSELYVHNGVSAEFHYLMRLLRQALTCREILEPPENLDYPELFRMARSQMIAATVFGVLPKNWMPAEIYKAWRKHADYTVRKEVLFRAERSAILKDFEQMEIDYLILKGIRMGQMYQGFLREFADNDILIYPKDENRVSEYLRARGYNERFGTVHNVYTKAPVYNFEIHKSLLAKDDAGYRRYCAIWDRAVLLDSTCHGYQMTDEDFYIFGILHIRKHDAESGIGLRNLADFWMMRCCFQDRDSAWHQCITRVLEEESVLPFYRELENSAEILFAGSGILTPDQEKALQENGCYGTRRHLIDSQVRKMGKMRYLLSRLVPSDSEMTDRFPILRRHRWMMPVLRIVRGAKLFFRRDTLRLLHYTLKTMEKKEEKYERG